MSGPIRPGQEHVYLFRVDVQIERRQIVTRHMGGSTAGNRVLKTLNSTPIEMVERGISASYWQPMGRDQALEQRLMSDIVRASIWAPSEAVSTEPAVIAR